MIFLQRRHQEDQGHLIAVGGVYASIRNTPPASRENSLTSIDFSTDETQSQLSSSSDKVPLSPASSWKTTGTIAYHRNSPLIASDPEHPVDITNVAAALGKIMERSRRLPSSTGYFASNHIMVNEERSKRCMAPLFRLRELDQIARDHAQVMANNNAVFHSTTPDEVHAKFHLRPSRRLGENVARGETIKHIHRNMMASLSQKNNILDRRYTHMGMGTARGPRGEVYLCQVFRG